jgi:hypothetical protein
MPNMTPPTPPTTAPADRLDLTEANMRTAGVEAATINIVGSYSGSCFADNE